MKGPQKTQAKSPPDVPRPPRWASPSLLLFVPVFFYLWLWVRPELLYHAFGTVLPGAGLFSASASFLKHTLATPAGLVIYLSGFLSQGYYHSWLGALIILLCAMVFTELCRRHLVHAGLPRPALLTCLPAILFLIMIGRYTHPLLACLTVSAGLLFSLVFERLDLRTTWARLLVYVLMAVIGYAVMGAGGLAVFTLMTAVYSVFIHRQWWLGIFVVLACIACIACLAESVYLLPRQRAFLITTPILPEMTVGMKTLSRTLLFILYAFVPAAVTLLLAGRIVWSRKGVGRAPKAKGRKHSAIPKPGSAALAFGKRVVVAMLPLVGLAAGLIATYESPNHDLVRVNACARQGQWSRLLDVARRLPKGKANIACNHEINRALYHTGRLPYEMFSFPQNPHALLLTHQGRVSSLTELQLCEVFTELGNVNTAEKMASELLAEQGNLGVALENLALISIVKGQPETARVYLNVLQQDLVYRHRAGQLLAGLDAAFAPDVAARIDRIRSCMPTDLYGTTYGGSVEDILTGLLEQNPRNKMAFEYLMACYLLTRQLDKVIANLDRLDDFGYEGVPTYYEEAMLIHRTMRRQPIDPVQLGISPATFQRYTSYLQVSRALQSANQQAAMNRLIREFGDTFFFYYAFGRVGVALEGDLGGADCRRAGRVTAWAKARRPTVRRDLFLKGEPTMRNLSLVWIAVGMMAIVGRSGEPEPICDRDCTAYLMAYFGPEEKLFYAVSNDARHWTALNGGKPVFDAKVRLRDPFVNRVNGRFHLVHTKGWDHPTIFHWESTDLIHWTGGPIDVVEPAGKRAWAPEFFYCEGEDIFYVFWASIHNGHNTMHYVTTMDWTDITPARSAVWYDIGIHDIDLTIVEHKGIYYGFHKPGDVDDRMGNRLSTVTSLDPEKDSFAKDGPGKEVFGGQIRPTEGPEVVRLIGQDKWYIYGDPFHAPLQAWETTDFVNYARIVVSTPEGAKHCSMISITELELDALRARYPNR